MINRIQALHSWYCGAMGTGLALNMATERYWFDWVSAGHTGPELRKVMVYLRKEIQRGRRNPGALSLRNLLEVERFEEDLVLAGLDLGKRLPALEEQAKISTGGNGGNREKMAARNDFNSPVVLRAMEELRRLKGD